MTSPISDDAMEAIRRIEAALRAIGRWAGPNLAEAIETALAPANSNADKWQDISTAPKDGTRVDLWHEDWGRQTDCYWGFPEHCCGEAGVHCDSDWHRLEAGWVDGTMNEAFDPNSFTHWRPVPAPPIGSGRTLADADKEPSP